MKARTTTLRPPVPIWKKTQVLHPIRTPNRDGDGLSESIEVLVDAWCNADGEIFLPGDVSEQIENLKLGHIGLCAATKPEASPTNTEASKQ